MYRKCTTERSAQHQRQVTASLLELMQKMPYEEITVTQLCQSAGVTRRIFYHLFNNKTGALYALMDQKILDIGSAFPEVEDAAVQFFLYWREQKQLFDALYSNGFVGLLLERMITNVLREDYDLLYWLHRKGWKQEQEVLIYHITGVMGLVCSWYFRGYDRSPEDMAALLRHMIVLPLAE